jgi:hypothetical protein
VNANWYHFARNCIAKCDSKIVSCQFCQISPTFIFHMYNLYFISYWVDTMAMVKNLPINYSLQPIANHICTRNKVVWWEVLQVGKLCRTMPTCRDSAGISWLTSNLLSVFFFIVLKCSRRSRNDLLCVLPWTCCNH